MPNLPEKIGKYEIIGLAGQGNMGIVYLGYDPFEDRDVAVKVCRIPEDIGVEIKKITRKIFFNEAHSAGALKHPNILEVYDAGEDSGDPYIVMEFVKGGETLKDFTDPESILPTKSVVEIFYQCAKALDYAHRHGVIHRDIKPTNIMRTPEGDVKIADFGVAYNATGDATQVMGIMGSPRYMSPEQIKEQDLTNKTDLYSLGIVAFELLIGRPPFPATSIPHLIRKIVNEPAPSVSELRPDLPGRLDGILSRVLEKDPDKRFGSGQELAAELAGVFGEFEDEGERLGDTVVEMSQTKKFEIARSLDFFNEFSDKEVDEVVRACSWQSYQSGEKIIQEGTRDRAFFILGAGDVRISIKDKAIARLSIGACFGEMGYITRTRRTATVTAEGDVSVLKVDAALLDQTSTETQLRFNQVFMKILLDRLAHTSDRLADLIN